MLAPLAAQPSPLQRLLYTYDPVGNIVEIEDQAQDKVFNEGVVEPRRKYEYDPLYRLVAATGREHQSQTLSGDQNSAPDALAQSIPASTDMQALRLYTQRYGYDPVGNIKRMPADSASFGSVNAWVRSRINRARSISAKSTAAALPARC